jgi:hypothetical protein
MIRIADARSEDTTLSLRPDMTKPVPSASGTSSGGVSALGATGMRE